MECLVRSIWEAVIRYSVVSVLLSRPETHPVDTVVSPRAVIPAGTGADHHGMLSQDRRNMVDDAFDLRNLTCTAITTSIFGLLMSFFFASYAVPSVVYAVLQPDDPIDISLVRCHGLSSRALMTALMCEWHEGGSIDFAIGVRD